ncbi:MAG: nucleotidyltransferase domain-containing protein [Candidatus Schekmanbacteria bacterium]|nr:nucleotidyltransferase domain-containing protein [Candidatus Schekmanbacteria bacterium]
MTEEELLQKDMVVKAIKEEFAANNINVKSILLFGSRAKGASKPDSDWDFLVVVDREIERRDRLNIVGRIRHRLAEAFIDVDVIVKSEESYLEQSKNVGYVTYYAAKEGILL